MDLQLAGRRALVTGSSSGIGYEMNNAESSFNMTWLWATLVLIAILGNLLNGLELAVQHRVLAWHRGQRQQGSCPACWRSPG